MKYAKIIKHDIGNWDGITTTIFFSGCRFNCPGCFNKELQNFNYGKPFNKEIEDLFISYANSKHVTGICILGGEPFQQDLDIMLSFVKRIKAEVNKPIHIWSGYTFESLLKDPKKKAILYYVDTLVDGQFVLSLKDLNLKYRGSSNQRVIDIQESLKTGEIKEII